MKNRKLLISKGIHSKRLGGKSIFLPKSAGQASFKSNYAASAYAKPAYNFSSN